MHLAQTVWIKDYRHSATSHKDPTSSKTWKYYKGKFYFLSFWLSFCTFFTLTCLFFSLGGKKNNPESDRSGNCWLFFFFPLKGPLIQHCIVPRSGYVLRYGRRSLITILLKYWLSVCNQQQFIAWVSVPKCLPLMGLVLLFIIAYFWVYLFKRCWMSFIHRNSKIHSRTFIIEKGIRTNPHFFLRKPSQGNCAFLLFLKI